MNSGDSVAGRDAYGSSASNSATICSGAGSSTANTTKVVSTTAALPSATNVLSANVAKLFFAEIYNLSWQARWASDDHFTADGTLIESWASLKSFIRKDGADAAKVKFAKDEYPDNPTINFRGENAATTRTRAAPIPRVCCIGKARCALSLALSPGNAGDAPQGRELLRNGGTVPAGCPLIMDRAYEGDETLHLARELGYWPVVPPNPNRSVPWEYDRMIYRRRNEIERFFRRLKAYRRVFSRFDRLDLHFVGFIVFALIFEALRFSVQ